MIVTKTLADGRILHYSDAGMMLRQIETGNLYEDAADIQPLRYSYEETDIPIPDHEEEATAEDYEAALNRLGVET